MVTINEQDQVLKLIKDEMGVLLYFFNDDCPPCISLRPKVETLVSEHFPKMKMVWVNSKTNPLLPAFYGVFANPTILVFFEGKEFKRFSKYVSVDELGNAIERYYSLAF
ncbi:MAG: thioredoxin family protein [Bacteroidales bacterium]|nr:thioredoxin family protein [Bacteroidales bacterium]